MKGGNPKTLKVPTSEEARKNGSKGGIKSGKVRREKKLMSQIYADLLADQSGIKRGGGIRAVVEEILNSTDPRAKNAKVSLIRELREGTEGQKIKSEVSLSVNPDDKAVAAVLEKYGVSKSTKSED